MYLCCMLELSMCLINIERTLKDFTYSIYFCRFKELLKKTKKELSEHENRELNLHQDIKNSQFEMDIPVNMLIKKVILNQFWGPKIILSNINLWIH